MTDHLTINQQAWDARVADHLHSDFYDVKGFLAGECQLNALELDWVGDVTGQKLLHLQCHFGMDSLSWVRRGAEVTAVDLSPEAIAAAKNLAAQANLSAEFIADDVMHYIQKSREFDLVFVSYGALCWLPDMTAWADGIARQLKSGGRLVLVEFHPVFDLLSGYSYFHETEPVVETETSYTENAEKAHEIAVWSHPTSDVLTALINAGLQIKQFKEQAMSPYDCFDGLVEKQPGCFYFEYQRQEVPLVYAVEAVKK